MTSYEETFAQRRARLEQLMRAKEVEKIRMRRRQVYKEEINLSK
jgi:hypothetical protein